MLKTKLGIPTNMGLDHVGIVVPNAKVAADFLIEVFDAEFDWEVKREPKPTAGERGWSDWLGVHPNSYMPHVIMLKCGDQVLTQYIELFEWKSPDQYYPPNQGWHKFSDIGNSYISFTVKDLDAVMQHIKAYIFPKWPGTRFIQDPPMQFPLRGEICTSTFLVSPWGMWIELTCWSQSKHKGQVIAAQLAPTRDKAIGQHINTLPTPSCLIDLDTVDHNTALLRKRIRDQGLDWRIPVKAHKCPALAKYLLSQGATGIVVLTLAEAEAFATAGIQDIYLANQVYTQTELERLTLVAKKIKRFIVAVDNSEYLNELAQAILRWEIKTPIEVLIELNINHNRCGTTIDDAVSLAKLTKTLEKNTGAVIFSGITGYEGHTPIMPPSEKTLATKAAHSILKEAKEKIEACGIKVKVVSGGGSCNYMDCLKQGILTEIQAGGGALCDLLYYHKAHLKDHGHHMGIFVLGQIISLPKDKSRAVANAGFKACGWHPFGGLPESRDYPFLKVTGLSAEHTRFDVLSNNADIKRGDKVVLIPGYTDAMGFLHRKMYAIRKDIVTHVWETESDKTWNAFA